MKKTFSTIAIILVFAFSNAQDTEDETKKGVFKVGANLGFELGYVEYESHLIGVDIAYLRKINEKVYVGATTGYTAYMGLDHVYTEDNTIHFFSLSATAQYSIFKSIYTGLDLGVGHYRQYGDYTTRYGMGYVFDFKLGYQRKIAEYYVAYKKFIISDNNFDINQGYFNLGVDFKIFSHK